MGIKACSLVLEMAVVHNKFSSTIRITTKNPGDFKSLALRLLFDL